MCVCGEQDIISVAVELSVFSRHSTEGLPSHIVCQKRVECHLDVGRHHFDATIMTLFLLTLSTFCLASVKEGS